MNNEPIAQLEAIAAELRARPHRMCLETNAVLMIDGAVNLLREADAECRTTGPDEPVAPQLFRSVPPADESSTLNAQPS